MLTTPARITLVGSVLAAALAISGCGTSDTNVNVPRNSKFDENSGRTDLTSWQMPTDAVNAYSYTGSYATVLGAESETETPDSTGYEYDSFKEFISTGYDDENTEPIGAVDGSSHNSHFDYTLAVGRDGAIWKNDDNGNNYGWTVALPASMTVGTTWVDEHDGYPWTPYSYTYNFDAGIDDGYSQGHANHEGGVLYYEYDDVVNNVTTHSFSFADLDEVVVATITATDAVVGSYTGLVKIEYTSMYMAEELDSINAVAYGLDKFVKSEVVFWKPGVGIIRTEWTNTIPLYRWNSTYTFQTVDGTQTSTETYDLVSSTELPSNG